MGTSNIDFFSNLYIHYYYGSYTKCGEAGKNIMQAAPLPSCIISKRENASW